MHEIVRLFAVTFVQITDKAARALFLDLLAGDEVELTGSLMRSHLFHYGLFGHKRSDRDVFLGSEETEAIARDVSAKHRQQHLKGRFLWSLWQFNPVYTMFDTGAWDDACRKRLKEFLTDPKALDALTLLFYGEGFGTGRDTISKIVDLDEYLGSVERRLGATDCIRPLGWHLRRQRICHSSNDGGRKIACFVCHIFRRTVISKRTQGGLVWVLAQRLEQCVDLPNQARHSFNQKRNFAAGAAKTK